MVGSKYTRMFEIATEEAHSGIKRKLLQFAYCFGKRNVNSLERVSFSVVYYKLVRSSSEKSKNRYIHQV